MTKEQLLLVGVNLLKHLPPYKEVMQAVNNQARDLGAPDAVRVLLSELKAKTLVCFDGDEEKTRAILQTKPVIIAANHQPNSIEPLILLAALPSRKDLRLITTLDIANVFGEETQKYCLCVYHPQKGESVENKEKRQAINERAIYQAIRELQGGKAMVIFPDGGTGTGKWRRGATRLVEGGLLQKDIYLVMAKIYCPKNSPYKLLFRTPFSGTVRFSEPLLIQSLPFTDEIKSMPPGEPRLKMKSLFLEAFYNQWAGKVTFE